MAEYTSRVGIKRRVRNVCFMTDGTIWVNYLLKPPAVSTYSDQSLVKSQEANAMLFRELENVGSDDYILSGLTVSVGEGEILNRIVAGLPNFSDENYPEARQQIRAFRRYLKSGYINERKRVFWLSVRYPARISLFERLRSRAFETDIFEDTSETSLASFDDKVFKAIPPSMNPVRTAPEHMEWLIERSTLRGVTIPEEPVIDTHTVLPGRATFPSVEFDEAASGTALLQDFVARFDKGDPSVEFGKQTFRSNFSDMQHSTVLSVRRPEMVSRNFPAGVVSYQVPLMVTGYPTREDYGFQNFTGIVDQATGMDGDFTLRFSYAPSMRDNSKVNDTLKELSTELKSNAESELDASDFDDRKKEVYNFYLARSSEQAPTPMYVTAFFCFGSGNLEHAEERGRAIYTAFSNSGFRVAQPPLSKTDMWELMLPCVASDSLVRDVRGTTTARFLGAYAPLRRYQLGDGVGIPFAVNVDNALGQLVHLDLVNATERGNASIALTGAQGRGKSYAMKVIATWMDALRLHLVMLDSQGEWATFATGLNSYEIIDLHRAKVSIDPLKVIQDPEAASELFVSLFLPLLGASSDSQVASDFAAFVSPENRRLHKDRNTARGVLEAIARIKDPRFMDIMGAVSQLLKNNLFAALVDPIDRGRVTVLPPAKFDNRVIVFLTRGLRLPRSGVDMHDMDVTERYTVMVNTAVARYTAMHFERIKSTGAFVGDEMSFYRGLQVLKPLIQDADRTGRKFGKFVMAGSQTDGEFRDDEYKLVRKRIVMGQERKDNAFGCLEWADFDTSDYMIRELVENTSPLDPNENNLPMRGRAGEAFFNDGVGKGKIRVLPQMQERIERLADTSTSKFIRWDSEAGTVDGDVEGVVSSPEPPRSLTPPKEPGVRGSSRDVPRERPQGSRPEPPRSLTPPKEPEGRSLMRQEPGHGRQPRQTPHGQSPNQRQQTQQRQRPQRPQQGRHREVPPSRGGDASGVAERRGLRRRPRGGDSSSK